MQSSRLALVTGASSGIGLELARQFAQNAHDLGNNAADSASLETAAQSLQANGDQAQKMPPDEVAKIGYEALMADDDHVVAGLKNKLQALVIDILPDPALAKMHRDMAQQSSEKQAAEWTFRYSLLIHNRVWQWFRHRTGD